MTDGQCPSCDGRVAITDTYCSGCGEPLTDVARYESRDEVVKVNSALRSLIILLFIVAARLSVPAAILGFIVGDWPALAVGVAIIAAILSFGLERIELWLVRRETPDAMLEEREWLIEGFF